MEDKLKLFFTDFCTLHSVDLEIKEVIFPKKRFWTVKMSRPNGDKICGGFFPDENNIELSLNMTFLLDQARNLFKIK